MFGIWTSRYYMHASTLPLPPLLTRSLPLTPPTSTAALTATPTPNPPPPQLSPEPIPWHVFFTFAQILPHSASLSLLGVWNTG